jgi:hypothetical protein
MSFGEALLINFAGPTAFLTLLLWLLVKLQGLDYSFRGLLGSAALTCALDIVPYLGHYLAALALCFCIWKVTLASLMPNAALTAIVSYALTFVAKVLLLMVAFHDFHWSVINHNRWKPSHTVVMAEPIPAFVTGVPATNRPAPVPVRKSADDWLKEVALKGATENGANSTVLLLASTNLYKLEMNQPTTVETLNGSCQMRLVNVSENWATVEVNGETAYLRLH